ncbi:mariner transposase [Trichonephila clavipes]|nr:mariner transposase [Trichonephila clavipes]
MMDRISICEALAKRNEIDPFLKRMVTGDKKWVTYDNIVRKRSWSKRGEAAHTVAKPGLTSRKVLLCIWWDWKGIIYYELLPIGQPKKCCVPSGQRQAPRVCSDSPETPGAWLESFNSSIIQSGPSTKRLPPFSRIANFPE